MPATLRRMVWKATVLAATMGIAWSVLAGTQDAAASAPRWWGPASDGCYYDSDDVAAYYAACLRTDGYVGVVAAQNGQWVLAALVGYDTYGCLAVWIGGNEYVFVCPPIVGHTLWGDFTITNWIPFNAYPAGSMAATSSQTLTGNPLIDTINLAASYNDTSLWLQPRCVRWEGNICYVEG